MKKFYVTLLFIAFCGFSFGQSQNITSAAILYKQFKKEKDKDKQNTKLIEAKDYIDQASENSSTSNDPKMWMVKAKVYLAVAQKLSDNFPDAIFDAADAHIQCMQPHPKKKNKIIIYRKWSKDEVLAGIINCAGILNNYLNNNVEAKDYNAIIRLADKINELIVFDENEVLKNSGITSDYLVFQQFFAYKNLNQLDEAKLALEKLIDNQYENPRIYTLISDIYLSENDEANALRYIALGRERFSQDQSLVDSEINLYITLGRTDELIENLSASIASYPDNVSYYVIRGTCYQNSNKLQEAILDYKSALNINPDHLTALNNISACYLSMTEPIITKLNALSYNETKKYNKYKAQIKDIHTLVLPYLEHYVVLDPKNKPILSVLAEIYYKLDMYAESKEIKERISSIQ